MLAAIGGFENGFWETNRVAVLGIQEIQFQNALFETLHLLPGAGAVAGGPNAAIGSHPAQRVAQKEQGDGLLCEIRQAPVLSAIAGRDHGAFGPSFPVLNGASRHATVRRGALKILDIEGRTCLVVEELNLPTFRRKSWKSEREKQDKTQSCRAANGLLHGPGRSTRPNPDRPTSAPISIISGDTQSARPR